MRAKYHCRHSYALPIKGTHTLLPSLAQGTRLRKVLHSQPHLSTATTSLHFGGQNEASLGDQPAELRTSEGTSCRASQSSPWWRPMPDWASQGWMCQERPRHSLCRPRLSVSAGIPKACSEFCGGCVVSVMAGILKFHSLIASVVLAKDSGWRNMGLYG